MLFSLEALDAAHGDSLFLHWRAKAGGKTHTALIDGGPTVTWKASLKPRLQELINAGGGELRLPFVMVSHVDSDHTGGLGKFFEWLDAQPQPRPVLIDTLWMNSFGALTTGRSSRPSDPLLLVLCQRRKTVLQVGSSSGEPDGPPLPPARCPP